MPKRIQIVIEYDFDDDETRTPDDELADFKCGAFDVRDLIEVADDLGVTFDVREVE